MRTSHWIKLVLIWLSLLVPTVIGVYLAISERRDIGVLGVAGAIFLGVHVIIAPFFGPAINIMAYESEVPFGPLTGEFNVLSTGPVDGTGGLQHDRCRPARLPAP